MSRLLVCLLLLAACLGVNARAEQLVVLRSGVEVVGDVSFEGDDVVVKLGESDLRLPQEKVARVAAHVVSEGPAADNRAQRLLLEWLESQALKGNGVVADPGVLAEANRLAPEDARIAYWYVTSLVGAGEGQAARGVFEKHRAAIMNQYPAMAADLQRRIADRVKIEQRPVAFVKRYDQLVNQLGSAAELPSEERLMAAAFRLTDQKGEAVPEQSITPSDSDCRVEPFADGWYLCTYMGRGTSRDQTVTLRIADPGYASQEYEIQGGADSVRDAGELRAHKRDSQELVKTRFKVIGADGKPLEGARLTLRPTQLSRGGTSIVQLSTSSKGVVEKDLFPGDYFVNTLANSYLPDAQPFRVESSKAGGSSEKSEPIEIRPKKAINGTVRVAWHFVNAADDEADNDSEQTANLPFVNGQLAPMGIHGMWLNVRQSKEGLFFTAADQRLMHYGPAPSGDAWTRVAKVDFDRVDLADIASLKKDSEKPKRMAMDPSRGSMTFPYHLGAPLELQPGRVYFGETTTVIPGRGPQNLQTLRFKFVFESAEEATEKPSQLAAEKAGPTDSGQVKPAD